MKSVVILTATYNHPKELKILYSSLCKQTDNAFTWLVVNDGSEKETEEILAEMEHAGVIEVIVINQMNGGKGTAINSGLNCLDENVEFVVIVDDDECLFPNAVQLMRRYAEKYRNTECGVIHFNRQNENGEILANPLIKNDKFMSYQKFKSEGRYADGYVSYFVKKLGNARFCIYAGEKYIAPSTLFMKVTQNSKLLWGSAVLGETEYLTGGITKQGRKLRIKNPQGMIEYCRLMQDNGASLKTRICYSIQGYAYLTFCKNKKKKETLVFNRLMYLPGMLLGAYWKKKYQDK